MSNVPYLDDDERISDAMREAEREAEKCAMFDDPEHYKPGARYW